MSIQSSNITSGFIDLATYDELEKYMYGCGDAVAYFVRTTCKSTWFTQVPVVLSNASGQPKFGQSWSCSISRAGDYLLQTWLRVGLKQVQSAANSPNGRLRWTRNLMHNLVKECAITFNDLVAARFDSTHLDFWSAFTVPKGKQLAYNNMIGNTVALTNPCALGAFLPPQLDNLAGAVLQPSVQQDGGPTITYLNLPLPFFFSRDSGVALPTAALPYNEMRINFTFRNWNELLIAERNVTLAPANSIYQRAATVPTDVLVEPDFESVQVWANYAIVSNDERKRMACAPRDILIEQAQMASQVTVDPGSRASQSIDLRLSHAIKVLFLRFRISLTLMSSLATRPARRRWVILWRALQNSVASTRLTLFFGALLSTRIPTVSAKWATTTSPKSIRTLLHRLFLKSVATIATRTRLISFASIRWGLLTTVSSPTCLLCRSSVAFARQRRRPSTSEPPICRRSTRQLPSVPTTRSRLAYRCKISTGLSSPVSTIISSEFRVGPLDFLSCELHQCTSYTFYTTNVI